MSITDTSNGSSVTTCSSIWPYTGAPIMPGEEERADAVRRLVAHVAADVSVVHDIAELAATLLDCPSGLVTFVGHEQGHVMGAVGFAPGTRIERSCGFCAWSLVSPSPEPMVIDDMRQDARFASNPWVSGPPHVRAYLGSPLVTSTGVRLGMLCVIDSKPRSFSAECINLLANLAELVVQELEEQSSDLIPEEARVHRKNKSEYRPTALLSMADPGWEVLFHTEAWPGAPEPIPEPCSSSPGWTQYGSDGGTSASGAAAAAEGAEAAEAAAAAVAATTTTASAGSEANCSADGCDLTYAVAGAAKRQQGCFWDAFQPISSTGRSAQVGRRSAWFDSIVKEDMAFQVAVRSRDDPSQIMYFDLRPATTADLWDDMVQVPISMSRSPEGATQPTARGPLYFAVMLNPSLAYGSAGTGSGSAGTGSGSGGSSSSSSVVWGTQQQRQEESPAGGVRVVRPGEAETPFEGVQLGPLLGRGAFGEVYMGIRDGGRPPVAVKVIRPWRTGGRISPGLASRVASALEGELGLELVHDNVVRTLQVATTTTAEGTASDELWAGAKRQRRTEAVHRGLGTAQTHALAGERDTRVELKTIWLMLELCTGGTLQDALDRGLFRRVHDAFAGGPDLVAILKVSSQIAAGMAHLHSQDVLHGDLSPKNVLLARKPGAWDLVNSFDMVAKVSDLGLARRSGRAGGSGLHDGDVLESKTHGTVSHMPSEALVSGGATKAVDVFSFGVILWELYTGRRAYAGTPQMQVVALKIMGKADLEFPDGTPPEYRALAQRCMHSDPAQRPAFEEVLQELERLSREGCSGAEFPVWCDPTLPLRELSARLSATQVCAP